MFEKRYSFQPFEDSTLLEISNQADRPYMSYLSFSMLIGNVLAFNMFLNEDPDMLNPCYQLESTKFGTAAVGFLIFDDSKSSVRKILWKEIQMN